MRREKHGQAHTPLYHVWCDIKRRCAHPRHRAYFGIRVCDEWQRFSGFYKWALENGYTPGLWIDRKDSRLGYAPSNCRWVVPSVSNINRRGWSASGFRGVEVRGKRFIARIKTPDRKAPVYLGMFDSAEAAARAYDAKAIELHGEYAFLNFKPALQESP